MSWQEAIILNLSFIYSFSLKFTKYNDTLKDILNIICLERIIMFAAASRLEANDQL